MPRHVFAVADKSFWDIKVLKQFKPIIVSLLFVNTKLICIKTQSVFLLIFHVKY